MKKLYLFSSFWLFFLLIGVGGALAQQKVTGRVVSVKGEPLVGVNIVEKGTLNGIITDFDGNYSIDVKNGEATLKFSYIGFKEEEVPVKNRSVINVSLQEDLAELDEVVVVGYGTQKRVSITGSISSVSSREIEKVTVANMSTVLGGRLPGLVSYQSSGAPGADDATLLIRGRNTTGNSSPVIIVDGVQRSFNNLDPNEIESVTVLKDASAAAVYGVQGANGVILVTTKRGVKEKAKVTYSSSFSLSQNTRFPKFMDGVQYATAYNKARELDGLPIVFSEAEIEKIKNGDPDGIFGNTNWVDQLFDNNSPTQHHNISVRGGSEKISYFVTAGYYDQEGSIKGFNFKRYNLRSNVDAQVTDHLKISFDLAARLEERNRPYYGVGKNDWNNLVQQAIRSHPYLPMYTPEGKITATRTAASVVNPAAARDLSGFNNSEMSVFQSNLSLQYEVPFVKGLTLKMMGSYDRDYTYAKVFNTPYKLQVFNLSTMNYQEQWAPNSTSGKATLSEGFAQASRMTLQPSVNYARMFNDLHDINLLVLYEQSSRVGNGFNATKRDFDFLELPELNFGKEIPDAKSVTGSSYERPRAGFVSRFNYAYARKYLVELASRYDGSYMFHKDSRWGFFPAASVGWVMSSEDFFKNAVPAITHLKLRGSAGMLGNDQISEYMYLSTMSIAPNAVVLGDKLMNSIYTGAVPNRDITWETTTTYDIGFESQWWNGLLGIEFDWFYAKTKDILRPVSGLYPPSMGGNFPGVVNSGKVDNRGFDLSLSHRKTINEFKYDAKLNVNWSRNRILKIDESPNIPDYLKQTGRRIGEKHGLVALGLFQTDEDARFYPTVAANAKAGDIRYQDLNGDGKINYDQDRTWIGKSNIPELMFGLNLNASWKNFDFSALVQGAAIADLALMGWYDGVGYDNTEFTRSFYSGGNSPVYLIDGSWTPDNLDARYPRLSTVSRPNNNWSSTFWIVDASYVRLKNIQLGYTLPQSLLQRVGVDALRLYVGGTNLFTMSQFKYLDPEAPDVNNGYYPQQKTFTFGLNLTL